MSKCCWYNCRGLIALELFPMLNTFYDAVGPLDGLDHKTEELLVRRWWPCPQSHPGRILVDTAGHVERFAELEEDCFWSPINGRYHSLSLLHQEGQTLHRPRWRLRDHTWRARPKSPDQVYLNTEFQSRRVSSFLCQSNQQNANCRMLIWFWS